MKHDPRFKHLLQEFFAEFLMLFFPRQAARLDFRHFEWLDKAAERGAAAFAARMWGERLSPLAAGGVRGGLPDTG
jgi:hypothetical protein